MECVICGQETPNSEGEIYFDKWCCRICIFAEEQRERDSDAIGEEHSFRQEFENEHRD